MASLPPVYLAELLASPISMFTTILLKESCISQFPCLGQENELVIGHENKFGHNEDMKGSCMEIEPSPPSYPYGTHL